MRASHRPVVTRADPTTRKKTSTQMESTKKEAKGLFPLDSLAYESKSNRWKRCVEQISFKAGSTVR